jgi:hypothetical protein
MTAIDDDSLNAVNAEISDSENEEGEDTFVAEPVVLLDRDSLARIGRDRLRGPPSVASTDLASTVGSVIGPARDACRKSITFYHNESLEWGITLCAADFHKRGFLKKKKPIKRLFVAGLSGCFEHSKLHEGDFLATINDKPAPSDPDLAVGEMRSALRNDGYLSVSVENPEGSEILMQATVIKPRPNMTYEEMGMVVWNWPLLCIRTIVKDTIFALTLLRDGDHIVAINDIETEDMKVDQFAHIMTNLDHEITITVLRRKQRLSGNFS